MQARKWNKRFIASLSDKSLLLDHIKNYSKTIKKRQMP